MSDSLRTPRTAPLLSAALVAVSLAAAVLAAGCDSADPAPGSDQAISDAPRDGAPRDGSPSDGKAPLEQGVRDGISTPDFPDGGLPAATCRFTAPTDGASVPAPSVNVVLNTSGIVAGTPLNLLIDNVPVATALVESDRSVLYPAVSLPAPSSARVVLTADGVVVFSRVRCQIAITVVAP